MKNSKLKGGAKGGWERLQVRERWEWGGGERLQVEEGEVVVGELP